MLVLLMFSFCKTSMLPTLAALQIKITCGFVIWACSGSSGNFMNLHSFCHFAFWNQWISHNNSFYQPINFLMYRYGNSYHISKTFIYSFLGNFWNNVVVWKSIKHSPNPVVYFGISLSISLGSLYISVIIYSKFGGYILWQWTPSSCIRRMMRSCEASRHHEL